MQAFKTVIFKYVIQGPNRNSKFMKIVAKCMLFIMSNLFLNLDFRHVTVAPITFN